MTRVAIALGSNLGDRRGHLEWAITQLRRVLRNVRVSRIIETEPVDVPDEQPLYLNAVVVGETALAPEQLLKELVAIERARGREGKALRAARTLDLDIILYGDRIVRTAELEIPHPRFRQREFVLGPLAELEPEWMDPATGESVADVLKELRRSHGES